MGIDEVGIDKVGIDEVGRYHREGRCRQISYPVTTIIVSFYFAS